MIPLFKNIHETLIKIQKVASELEAEYIAPELDVPWIREDIQDMYDEYKISYDPDSDTIGIWKLDDYGDHIIETIEYSFPATLLGTHEPEIRIWLEQSQEREDRRIREFNKIELDNLERELERLEHRIKILKNETNG